MKRTFVILLFFASMPILAQVGINTMLPSAQLDVRSSNQAAPAHTDGMLIPKVDNFPLTNPTADQHGMMVFLTTASGSNQPGFYYWNHPTTSWIGVGTSVANQWNLTGNAGTNPATSFIGTTDNQDVVFRRNSVLSGQISTYNSSFGMEALRQNSSGILNTAIGGASLYQNTTGMYNTAVGTGSLRENVSGNYNTAVGVSALVHNINGGSNVAVGCGSLAHSASATGNVAIGANALTYNSGHYNTAVGRYALYDNETGTENTAIGAMANIGSGNLQNATAIGAGSKVEVSNALVLGSVQSVSGLGSNVNVGIGTTAPLHALHVSRGSSGATGNANAHFVIEDNAAAYQHFLTPAGNESGILFGNPTGSTRGGIIFNSSSNTDGIQFRTGGNASRMTIDAIGNVGIGTITPAQKLHVSGGAGLTAVRIGNTSTGGTTSNVALDFFRATDVNTDWRIFNIGPNLTIGNSGDDLATVNNLYQFQGGRFIPMIDGTISLGQAGNRWNTLFASNGTINTSDARQKKNIRDLDYGLEELMKLRPVSFEWIKDDGSGTKLGLIAQELQQVLPEVVRDWDWSEDGKSKVSTEILGVYYSDLIPVLIKATQEQQQIINSQNEKLAKLESETAALQEKFETQQQEIVDRLRRLEDK